ncbi:response regulator [Corallococcus carmarthensis]|uniref:Response regulator n=1 Tax=Corallococcus carmarthensis TaxID=2316728 RepID=A0A3A8K1V0_9BACT|nr:response regulator [Corallococcus carmarthensis]NOK17166.1 response regulator [Corallococcus carmarthensis]RKH01980.1 response regulator [Corallococcus carmarthensis]
MTRRILVVEDDFYIREAVRELLEDEGHTVDCAENGAQGLAMLEGMQPLPDVILLDLMMPVKDGFQFRSEQRADDRFADIPVVVMSADPQLDSRKDLLEARAYLRKPVDMDQLLDAAAA